MTDKYTNNSGPLDVNDPMAMFTASNEALNAVGYERVNINGATSIQKIGYVASVKEDIPVLEPIMVTLPSFMNYSSLDDKISSVAYNLHLAIMEFMSDGDYSSRFTEDMLSSLDDRSSRGLSVLNKSCSVQNKSDLRDLISQSRAYATTLRENALEERARIVDENINEMTKALQDTQYRLEFMTSRLDPGLPCKQSEGQKDFEHYISIEVGDVPMGSLTIYESKDRDNRSSWIITEYDTEGMCLGDVSGKEYQLHVRGILDGLLTKAEQLGLQQVCIRDELLDNSELHLKPLLKDNMSQGSGKDVPFSAYALHTRTIWRK